MIVCYRIINSIAPLFVYNDFSERQGLSVYYLTLTKEYCVRLIICLVKFFKGFLLNQSNVIKMNVIMLTKLNVLMINKSLF